MSVTDDGVGQLDRAEEIREQDEQKGPSRVVLRGVRALVLDDLPAAVLQAVLEAAPSHEPVAAWIAVAARQGTVEAAIRSHAGQSGAEGAKAGHYKAPPAASWFVSPLVIEPPLG